jgi:hypothetical protein
MAATHSGAATVPVLNGSDLATIMEHATPNTTYQLERNGSVSASKEILLSSGQDGITVDGNGGSLTTEVKGTLFNVRTGKFTLCNFGKDAAGNLTKTSGLAGHPETILVTSAGQQTTITNNVVQDGFMKFAFTETGNDGLVVSNNNVGQTASVTVYICTSNSTITGNTFAGSWAEYVLRYSPDTDNRGNPIYVNNVLQRPSRAIISANRIVNHNSKGKQAIGFRAVDEVDCFGNTIDGVVRVGEPIPATGAGKVTPDARCAFFSLHGNTFLDSMSVSSPATVTNTVQVYGGATGAITGNTFKATADIDPPLAIATNNAITVSGNVQQFAGTMGTARGGATASIVLGVSESDVNGAITGQTIIVAADMRAISGYVGSSRMATVDKPWTAAPAAGKPYGHTGQRIIPLIAPTADSHSYHNSGSNQVVIVP